MNSSNFNQICEIAREVTRGYTPEKLPNLEEISWAFPVDGQDRVYYERDGYMNRIPNIQEGNAMYQLMLLRNLDNVLRFLSEGKTCDQGITPTHAVCVGDAEDMAYMQTDYWTMLPADIKKTRFEGLKLIKPKSYFWDNVPEKLVKAILRTDTLGRGVKDADEWGMYESDPNKPRFTCAYDDAELTRKYLREMRTASEIGREYFQKIAKSSEQAKRYPQLVTAQDVSKWTDQVFQWGYYQEGEPCLLIGKVLSNLGDKLELELVNPIDVERHRKNSSWNVNYEINTMNEFCVKNLIWALIPPQAG